MVMPARTAFKFAWGRRMIPCTVGAVLHGDVDPSFFQTFCKAPEFFKLLHSRSDIRFICPGEMSENALDVQIGNFRQRSDFLQALTGVREPNARHSRIQRKMDMYGFSKRFSGSRIAFCAGRLRDSNAYTGSRKLLIIFFKNVS